MMFFVFSLVTTLSPSFGQIIGSGWNFQNPSFETYHEKKWILIRVPKIRVLAFF